MWPRVLLPRSDSNRGDFSLPIEAFACHRGAWSVRSLGKNAILCRLSVPTAATPLPTNTGEQSSKTPRLGFKLQILLDAAHGEQRIVSFSINNQGDRMASYFDEKAKQVEPGDLVALGIKITSRYSKADE